MRRRGVDWVVVGAIVLILGIFAAVPAAAAMEARTYSRLTGKRVTWFDALWVELRVDCHTESR